MDGHDWQKLSRRRPVKEKEMVRIRNTEIGRCKYCRREQVVIAESRYDADEEVTERCLCPGSKRAKKFERALENLEVLEIELKGDEEATRQLNTIRLTIKKMKNEKQIKL